MSPETRLTGEPIMRILCKKTDTLVGYLYQWNNGDLPRLAGHCQG
jgi:hypothetical protein